MISLLYFIPLIAFWFANITGIPQKFSKAFNRNVKPFSCTKCLSFWMALIHEACIGFSVDSLWRIPICSLAGWLVATICIKLKLPLNV